MITRFYVDNYKCLVNFEYKPKGFELILGANGSGKSTAFEALSRLRDFVVYGGMSDQLFPSSSCTRWPGVEIEDMQTFNLDISLVNPYDEYELESLRYILHIKHDSEKRTSQVLNEFLFKLIDGQQKVLFSFMDGEIYYYRDDYSERPPFPASQSRSALSTMPERNDSKRLTLFKQALSEFLIVHINPMMMDYGSEKEVSDPAIKMTNFVAWYRHHSQENPEAAAKLSVSLSEIFDDFGTLQLLSTGSDRRELMFKTKGGKNAPSYRFDELSDGQRALIVLYAILHFSVSEGAVVCIDEPENFIALRELQPLLFNLRDAQEENGGQVLLISHHPEFINILAPAETVRFEREAGGHMRVKPFESQGVEGISPAELVARGWEG